MAHKKIKSYDIVITALMTALIAVCSLVAIPVGAVPVTLQTFAVFVAIGICGCKKGTVAVLLYILLGIVGLPVFSGFQSGIGVLAGPTGGYISGFLLSALVSGFIAEKTGRKIGFMILSFSAGLVICYLSGLLWYIYVFSGGKADFASAFSLCVLPYIIPDGIKIILAAVVSKTVGERLKKI